MTVKMPEPTAYASSDPVRKNQLWSRAQYDSALPKNREYCDIPLITTTQAEAYADARVREALERASNMCDERAMSYERATENCDGDPEDISELRSKAWVISDIGRGICALIPPTE